MSLLRRLLARRSESGNAISLASAIAILILLPPAVFLPLMDSTIKNLVFGESRLVSSVPVIYGEVWFPFTFGFLLFALLWLAFDLADRLPAGMVILPGAAKPAAVRSIDVAFQEIAAGPDAKIVVDARWSGTRHEHIEVPIASLDSANVATGMSQALATLADRIIAGLR